jgi:hypothetical protein
VWIKLNEHSHLARSMRAVSGDSANTIRFFSNLQIISF